MKLMQIVEVNNVLRQVRACVGVRVRIRCLARAAHRHTHARTSACAPPPLRHTHAHPRAPLPPTPLQALERGLPTVNLMENWDFLQVQCAMYINSDLPGVSSVYNMPGKPMR